MELAGKNEGLAKPGFHDRLLATGEQALTDRIGQMR